MLRAGALVGLAVLGLAIAASRVSVTAEPAPGGAKQPDGTPTGTSKPEPAPPPGASKTAPGLPTQPQPRTNPRSRLPTWELGGTGVAVVLLHGYGSNPEDWFPFVETVKVPTGGRFVFPRAPEATVPPDGPVGGRGWWRLGLFDYVRTPGGPPDLSQAHPEGLTRAAGLVTVLLDELAARPNPQDPTTPGRPTPATPPPPPAILGGFSQGAMVAAEITFTTPTALSALILLSGTPVDEVTWLRGAAQRKDLPVFIAHGRGDAILPFAGSQRLARKLIAAGLRVTFVPFEGGHEIPPPVVEALNRFLSASKLRPGARPRSPQP